MAARTSRQGAAVSDPLASAASPQFPTSFYAYVVDASSTAGDLPLSYGLFFDAVGYRRRMDLPSVDGANASSAAAHNTSLIQVFDQGVNGANKTGLANVTLLHHGMQLALNTVARGQGNLARLVLPPMQLNGTGVVRGVACTVWVTTVGTSKLTIWSPVGTTLIARAWLGTHTRVDFVGMVPGVHEWDWPWATPRDYSTRAVHSQNATCFWCDLWKPAQIKGQDGGESIWWQDGAQRRAFWFYGDTVMPVHWPTNTLLMVNATAEGKVTGARYLVNSTSGRAVSAVPPFPAPAAGQDCYHLWLGAGVAARGTMYVHFQQLYAGGANHPSCKPLGGDTGFGMVTAPLGATHFNAVTDPAAGGSFTRFPYLTDACLFPDGGDDYVYSYELDSPTHAVYLRRVDVSSITDPAEYDVWVGSHNGSPLWQRVAGANHTGPRVPFLRGMSNQVTVQVFPYLSG